MSVAEQFQQLEAHASSLIIGQDHLINRMLIALWCDGLTLDPHRPLAVLLPETTQQVARIVRACREADVHFVPRGAGTGLSGGAHATPGSVLIECSRMNGAATGSSAHASGLFAAISQ